MLRAVFTITAGLSLLLLIAAAVVWARSHYVYDHWIIAHPRTGGTYRQTSQGTARLTRLWWSGDWRSAHQTHAPRPLDTASNTLGVTELWFDFARISYGKGRVGVDAKGWLYIASPDEPSWPTSTSTAPLWLIVAVLAVLPAVWLATWPRHRRRVRRRRGLCERCGYDLRGSAGGVSGVRPFRRGMNAQDR